MSTARPLRAFVEVALGRQRSPQHETGQFMVPYLRAANVKDGSLDLADVKSMNFTPDEQKLFALRAGDVLVSEGSGSLSSVGASCQWSGEIAEKVCFQNTLLRLRPRSEATDHNFLAWWARHAFASGMFASVATGANIFHISAERVRSLPVRFPSPAAQRAIAASLDVETARMANLVAARQRQGRLLAEYRQGLFTFTANSLMRRWGGSKLRYALNALDQGWSPECEDRLAEENEWGVVKAGCINGGSFRPDQHKALPLGVPPRSEYRLNPGDLLMSRASGSLDLIGSVGVVPSLNRRLLLCDKLFRLRVDERRLNPVFAGYMLRTEAVRAQIKLGVSGAKGLANNLPHSVVKDLVIPVPPLDIQEQTVSNIAGLLAKVHRAERSIEAQIALLVQRRQVAIVAAVSETNELNASRM